MELKTSPAFVKEISGRIVTGIFAVHGNIDLYGDVSHPGSFAKTISERGTQGKVRFLWAHDPSAPPVATVRSIREVLRDELPEKVLAAAPEATGGVEIAREYLDTPRGSEILKGIEAEAIGEMSYGYDPVKFDFGEQSGTRIRNLREVKLWEVSDVVWGANEATAASKALRMPLPLLMAQMEAYLAELKSGARHSAGDTKLINSLHHMIVDLGATVCKGKADEDEAADEGEKSRAGSIPLTLLRQKIALLELEVSCA